MHLTLLNNTLLHGEVNHFCLHIFLFFLFFNNNIYSHFYINFSTDFFVWETDEHKYLRRTAVFQIIRESAIGLFCTFEVNFARQNPPLQVSYYVRSSSENLIMCHSICKIRANYSHNLLVIRVRL